MSGALPAADVTVWNAPLCLCVCVCVLLPDGDEKREIFASRMYLLFRTLKGAFLVGLYAIIIAVTALCMGAVCVCVCVRMCLSLWCCR